MTKWNSLSAVFTTYSKRYVSTTSRSNCHYSGFSERATFKMKTPKTYEIGWLVAYILCAVVGFQSCVPVCASKLCRIVQQCDSKATPARENDLDTTPVNHAPNVPLFESTVALSVVTPKYMCYGAREFEV